MTNYKVHVQVDGYVYLNVIAPSAEEAGRRAMEVLGVEPSNKTTWFSVEEIFDENQGLHWMEGESQTRP